MIVRLMGCPQTSDPTGLAPVARRLLHYLPEQFDWNSK